MELIPGINRFRFNNKIIDVLAWYPILIHLDNYDKLKKDIQKIKSKVTRQGKKIDKLEDEYEIEQLQESINCLKEELEDCNARINIIEEEILNKNFKIYINDMSIRIIEESKNKFHLIRKFQQDLSINIDPILHASSVINRFGYKYFGIGEISIQEFTFTKYSSLKKKVNELFDDTIRSKILSLGSKLIEYQGRDLSMIEQSRSLNDDKNKNLSILNEYLCEDYIEYFISKMKLSKNYDIRSRNLIYDCRFLGRRALDLDKTKLNSYIDTGYSLLYVENLSNHQHRCKILYKRIISYINLLLLEEDARYYGLENKPPMKTFLHKYNYDGFFNSLIYLRKLIIKKREDLIIYINQITTIIQELIGEEIEEDKDDEMVYESEPDDDLQKAILASMEGNNDQIIDL